MRQAMNRARSRATFIAKIGPVIEESDESGLWMELIIEGGILPNKKVVSLPKEVNERVAIMTAFRKTAQEKK